MPIDLGRYAPDPIGSAFRGFMGMGQIQEQRRKAELEERRFKLTEDEAARRRQLFDLQLEQAQEEAAERKKLPGARAGLLAASRPLMSLEEVGGDPEIQKLGLGGIRQMSQRPRTLQALMDRLGEGGAATAELAFRGREGERFERQLGLSTPEAVEKEDEATRLTTEALEDIKGGRVIEGLTKANRALILSGQRPAFKDLADVIQDDRDRKEAEQDAKTLGPMLAAAAGGSEEDAKKLLGAIPGARSKGFKAFVPHLFNLATTILGAKVSPKVVQGLKRYTELLQESGDPVTAMGALTAENPEQAVAIRQAKMLPVEFEEAIRDAAAERREGAFERRAETRDRLRRSRGPQAQAIAEDANLTEDQKRIRIAALGEDPARYLGSRAGSEAAIKTLEAHALRVAAKTFPQDQIKQRALAVRLQKQLSTISAKATVADIEKMIDDEVAAAKGEAVAPPAAKEEKRGLVDAVLGFFGRGKPATPTAPGAAPAPPAPVAPPAATVAPAEAQRAARDALVNALYPGRAWQELTQEEKRAVGRRLLGAE